MTTKLSRETYLNAASIGLPDRSVFERMITHLELEASDGSTRATMMAADEFASVRTSAAQLLNASVHQVGFATTTSEAWFSIAFAVPMSGKRLLAAPHEWGDNIRLLERMCAMTGAVLEILPPIDFAAPDLAPWQERLDDDVAAIFVPMISSVAGHLYPVAEIGRLERPCDCLFIIDGAQALGQCDIDINRLGCDAFVSTTRKWLRGPRETELFWVSDNASRMVPDLTVDNLEPFDANVAMRLGLGMAINIALSKSSKSIEREVKALAAFIRAQAEELGLTTLGHADASGGAVSLLIPKPKTAALQTAIAAADCVVKWPNAVHDEPSAPAIDPTCDVLRIAPHSYNTPEDINHIFRAITQGLCEK